MHKLKIGMISFAHMHAISYFNELIKLPDIEIVGIADENRERVYPFIEKFNIPYYKDYRDLLKTDVAAVIIASENVKHAEMTIESARHGKHVLCEKPLGTSMKDMKKMIEVCRENKVQLMTSFPNRYIPMIVEAKATIERGEIGEIVAVSSTNKGEMPGGWFIDRSLSGGGALLDHSVHVADILNWIICSPVTEVYAESGTLFHNIPIDDAGMVHIRYENGVTAVIDTSWSRTEAFPYKRDLTMDIIGTKGVISIDYFAQVNEVYSIKKNHAEWSYWGDNKDELLIKDFVRCIQDNRPVPITGEDGMNAAAVSLAAYESVRTKQPVNMQKILYNDSQECRS